MKKIRLFLGVIAIIALTGCLFLACDSSSDGGGGGTPPGGSDPAINGWNGGKSSGGGGGSRLPTGGSNPNKLPGQVVEWQQPPVFGTGADATHINITTAGVAILSEGATGQVPEYIIGPGPNAPSGEWSTTPPSGSVPVPGSGAYYVFARAKENEIYNFGTPLKSPKFGGTSDVPASYAEAAAIVIPILTALADKVDDAVPGTGITEFPDADIWDDIAEAVHGLALLYAFANDPDDGTEEQVDACNTARDALIEAIEAVIAVTDLRDVVENLGFDLCSYPMFIGGSVDGGVDDGTGGKIWGLPPGAPVATQLFTIGTPATAQAVGDAITLPNGWVIDEISTNLGSTYIVDIEYPVGDGVATYRIYIIAMAQYVVDWSSFDPINAGDLDYYTVKVKAPGNSDNDPGQQFYREDTHGGNPLERRIYGDNKSRNTGDVATNNLYFTMEPPNNFVLVDRDSNDPLAGPEYGNPFIGVTTITAEGTDFTITSFKIGNALKISTFVPANKIDTDIGTWLSNNPSDGDWCVDDDTAVTIIYIYNAQPTTYEIEVEVSP